MNTYSFPKFLNSFCSNYLNELRKFSAAVERYLSIARLTPLSYLLASQGTNIAFSAYALEYFEVNPEPVVATLVALYFL